MHVGGFRDRGFEFQVGGSGFHVRDFVDRGLGQGFRFRFGFSGSGFHGFTVRGFGFRFSIDGCTFRVFGIEVSSFELEVRGFVFRDQSFWGFKLRVRGFRGWGFRV